MSQSHSNAVASESGAPAESRTGWSISGFSWLAIVTTLTTYGLVVLGGVVRATDSGDACPDWPRCRGELLPPLDTNVMIEFSHRLVAVVIGLLILALALGAWRWQRGRATLVWGSTLALVLVVAQAILGGLTVINDLSPALVMAHLTTASALLLTLLFVTIESLDVSRASGGNDDLARFHRLAGFAALATFGLMLTGSYVSGSNAGLAITDWPLFNGRWLPDGGRLVMIHALHRFVAMAIGLVLLLVAAEAWRSYRWHRPAVVGAMLALGIYVAQAMVGAANVWSKLAPAATAAHLALAMALLAVLASLAMITRASMRTSAQAAPSGAGRRERATATGSLPVGRVT